MLRKIRDKKAQVTMESVSLMSIVALALIAGSQVMSDSKGGEVFDSGNSLSETKFDGDNAAHYKVTTTQRKSTSKMEKGKQTQAIQKENVCSESETTITRDNVAAPTVPTLNPADCNPAVIN